MDEPNSIISINYDPVLMSGIFSRTLTQKNSSIWERMQSRIIAKGIDASISNISIEIPWTDSLDIIREFGSKAAQSTLKFRFKPEGEAVEKIRLFVQEVKGAKQRKDSLSELVAPDEIKERLAQLGFTKRELKPFQLRDVQHLLSLSNGANFSVPGAGKTTVTFALHLLLKKEADCLLVVCPKAAFPAWHAIVDECIESNADHGIREPFIFLDGNENDTQKQLDSDSTRFIISYDLMVRQQGVLAAFMARRPVHLVLDEAHRMKSGLGSQRGAFLISIASLPIRRDILTGTPMPQAASDIESQLSFLWPGHGLGVQIQRGSTPREVLGNLYVRTTKHELGLPPSYRHYYKIDMSPAQTALYSVVRSEALRQLTQVTNRGINAPDYVRARKSVMRLLQLSTNPTLALQGMISDESKVDSGIVDAVIEEGTSNKMKAVAHHARSLSRQGEKSVIWTIFTNSINELEVMLADLNPVSIYGAVPSGVDSDPETREGKLKRFHNDESCRVLIANPAAAGEGISLHTVCHNAIYLDRSYVSTHYLQSIDRIHRLGLPQDIETHIHIYQTKAPATLGSIDLSVSRRLAMKIRNMQLLLDDYDLHQIALDEEAADDPVDYDVDMQDLLDLIAELEGTGASESSEDV